MDSKIRHIIRETLKKEFICEFKIDIEDTKKRGFAEEVGNMYKNALAELDPKRIYGKLGIVGAHGDASYFEITLMNGDIIQTMKYTNPAFAIIKINDTEYTVDSSKIFSKQFPELVKEYYLEYKAAKAGIPSR